MIKKMFLAVLVAFSLSQSVFSAPETLIVGGNVIGLRLKSEGVCIVEFTQPAAQNCGLKRGDVLRKINGRSITTAAEVSKFVEQCDGKPLKLTVLRGNEEKTFTLAPSQTPDGKCLGLLVRESLNGIGTVTYYDPESGTFGALGHGISDGRSLLPIRSGEVIDSHISSVQKGKRGQAGCLQATADSLTAEGCIDKNTPQGIFGRMPQPQGQRLPVAKPAQITTGKAQIISTVDGTQPRYYDVQILALYPREKANRNLLLQVTDEQLLSQTGGIVQGMSGSPIIQNGKLIGAVTHVLIDDPTKGYGIFIETMLEAA
ncbi:MAG: PDZ domain-containing protein [Ruminococcaceae bacterium]|nr:PDZ domain-containing protein [Oscillospiraceae bacterium]